ncbi:MAG: ABC transporter ATP-binding protein [Lachnospiraceae bacterium]|nr:ABC transporter ATP-binding protein [Lachnospiraceae bacterium]
MKKIFSEISYIFDRKQKRVMVLLLCAIFIGALFELLGVSLIMPLIQVISTPEMIEENRYLSFVYRTFGMTDSSSFFVFLASVIIAVYVFKNAYLIVMYHFQYSFIYNNQLKVAGRLVDCYLKKPYTYHLNNNTSNMIRNIMLDTERLFQLILSVLNCLSEALLCILLGLFMVINDPFMTITLAALLILCMGCYRLFTKKRVNEYGRINQVYDGRMHQSINQALGAVKDIKILHREKYFVDRFVESGEKKMDALINTNFFGTVPRYLIETVCVGGIILVLIIKLKTGTDLARILPMLGSFAVAAFKLMPSAGKISNYANLISFLTPSIDLIYNDIKETEDMIEKEVKDRGELSDSDIDAASIRVEDIEYSYPGFDEKVLEGADFEIPLGASVGLVGASGAGKSTLADVILGILFPVKGRVMYGKMNVHDYPLKWSEKLAYIPQAIFLADESIRDNVAFGIKEEEIDDEKVWAALDEAQLLDFVRELPDGLDTPVGERGVRLSGGQRQRIGIARALYDDPEILVLDEATSALDSETESAVMEAIDSLMGRKTLIIIAHRLTTIRNCQLIFRVENGRVRKVEKEELFP